MDRNSFYDNLKYYKKYSITHSGTPGTAGYKPEKPRDDHKYVEIRNGRYIYQEDIDREKEAQKTREQAQQEAYRREQERKNAEANRRRNAEAAANAEKDRYTQKQSQEYLQETGQIKTKPQQNNTEIQKDPSKASKEYLQETGQIKVEKPKVSTMSAAERQQQEAYKRQQEREAQEKAKAENARKNAEAAANAEKNKNANTNQNKQTQPMTTKSWEDEQREAHKRQQEREAEAKAREENARKNAEAAANAGKDRGKSEGKDKHDSDWNAKIEEEQTKWDKAIDTTYKENEKTNKAKENNIANKKVNSKAIYDNYKGNTEFNTNFSEAAQDLGINISISSNGEVIYYDNDLQNKINKAADDANAKFKEYRQAKEEAQSIQDPEERLKKL